MNQSNKDQQNFQRIRFAIDRFRQHDRSACGMIFTDNWYDSHPRLLIFDPILNPYDKLVWLTIRSFCMPDMSLAAFPSYDQIQDSLHISRGTVSSSITKLRATRWLTLVGRERIRNDSGQFTKDGNIYLIHGEPLGFNDTFKFDSNYMRFLRNCKSHRNSDVRKISELIFLSIQDGMDCRDDILEDRHPFDRRSNAWASVGGDTSEKFFEHLNIRPQVPEQNFENAPIPIENLHSTSVHRMNSGATGPEVHDMNYGVREPVVHGVNYGNRDNTVHEVNCGQQRVQSGSSSGFLKKSESYNYYHNITEKSGSSIELIYPSSLSNNQKHLIDLHLQRLPDSLPPVPGPWDSWGQLLLDELSGRIDVGNSGRCESVWNPVSLMSTYCERLLSRGLGLKSDGQFQIEYAESVMQKRKSKVDHRRAYEEVRKRYQQKIDRQIQEAQSKRSED